MFHFFAVWAEGVFYALPFGRGRVGLFAVCCLGGDRSSLTYRPAGLGCKGPNNKKGQIAKTKTWVPFRDLQASLFTHRTSSLVRKRSGVYERGFRQALLRGNFFVQ